MRAAWSTLGRAWLPALACLAAFATAPAAEARRPNILVVLADDLGFSDLGCYGGEIPTPRLDALAAGGLRFAQCYNSSRCCPSRASLLTGLTPHQAGIGRFVGRGSTPGYLGRPADRAVTLAEVLRPAGNATFAVGRWHVNVPGPTERGFDEFYGCVHSHSRQEDDPPLLATADQIEHAVAIEIGDVDPALAAVLHP